MTTNRTTGPAPHILRFACLPLLNDGRPSSRNTPGGRRATHYMDTPTQLRTHNTHNEHARRDCPGTSVPGDPPGGDGNAGGHGEPDPPPRVGRLGRHEGSVAR